MNLRLRAALSLSTLVSISVNEWFQSVSARLSEWLVARYFTRTLRRMNAGTSRS